MMIELAKRITCDGQGRYMLVQEQHINAGMARVEPAAHDRSKRCESILLLGTGALQGLSGVLCS